MRVFLACLVALPACRFDTSGTSIADGDPNQPDANRPDSAFCGFAFDPAHFAPCADPPAMPGGNLSLTGKGFTYDTDAGEFTPAVGGVTSPPNTILDGVRVIWVSDFSIKSSGSLRVIGMMPLMIVATNDIMIEGELDVSSTYDGVTFDPGAGASTDPDVCDEPPGAGVKCAQHGASGGGGGGFGTAGGQGDHGAANRDCGDKVRGQDPTAGGGMIALPTTVRAGCAGAPGASTDDGISGDEGLGGPSGGAVHLVAGNHLAVGAVIHAGGGAGGPGTDGRASGGGGGSGGYIGLEAREIELRSVAVLAANGGGGGGGCDTDPQEPGSVGENAAAALVAAAGGAGDDPSRNGNAGGILSAPPGAASIDADRGGGGGGGSVGYILVRAVIDLSVVGNPIVTPARLDLP